MSTKKQIIGLDLAEPRAVSRSVYSVVENGVVELVFPPQKYHDDLMAMLKKQQRFTIFLPRMVRKAPKRWVRREILKRIIDHIRQGKTRIGEL